MTTATIRVEDAREYGHEAGFVIEQLRYWNGDDHQTWAVAPWEEMGLGALDGVFATREEAETALASEQGILPTYC